MRASLLAKAAAATLRWVRNAGRLLCALLQDGTSPMHEKLSQIGVPAFANPEQFLLPPGGMFSRDDPEPGGELSPLAKGRSVADRRDDCGCRHRSDARNCHQPLAGFVLARRLLDHLIGLVDSHF